MPIKIKKFNIETDTEIPKPGYLFLGFDENGDLVQKDEYGEYKKVVSSASGTTFDSIITPYLTVGGTRVSGYPWGTYTIAQGTANICVGDTSFVRGRYSQTYGKYSFASGEYVSASGTSSYAWGSGINSSLMLISNGINSFVHQYCITDTAGTLSDYSVILGGYDNDIGSSSNSSVILGSNNNLISNSPRSMILGGYNNEINNLTNTIFIGRENLKTATYSNAVYVPKLCLDINLPIFPPSEDGVIWYDPSGSGDIKAQVNGVTKSMLAFDTTFLVTTNTNQQISGQKTFITNSPTFNVTSIFNNNSIYYSNIIFDTDGCEIKTEDDTGGSIGYNLTLSTGIGSNVSSGTAGGAGTLYIKGGNGGVSSSGSGIQGKGGDVIISGGNGGNYSTTYGKGGTVTISGGTGGSSGYSPGNVEIYSGKQLPNGRGGDIIIKTPSDYITGNIYIQTSDGAYNGGDILIKPGLGPSSNGNVYIGNNTSTRKTYKLHVSGHTIHEGVIFNYDYSNRAQFIGNWNQNLNDNWGIGTDGTTGSVIKMGRCDHLGVWNSNNVNVNIDGSLKLNKSNGEFINKGKSHMIQEGSFTNPPYTQTITTSSIPTSWGYKEITIDFNDYNTDKILYITLTCNNFLFAIREVRVAIGNDDVIMYWYSPSTSYYFDLRSCPIMFSVIVPYGPSSMKIKLYCNGNSSSILTTFISSWKFGSVNLGV